MDRAIRDILDTADWVRLTLRLTHYLKGKVRHLRWRTDSYDMLAKGKSVEDLVDETILAVFDESRKWNSEKEFNLEGLLFGTAQSIISNLVKSSDNKKIVAIKKDENGSEQWNLYNRNTPSLNEPATAEESLIANEDEELIVTAYKKVLSELQNDPELEGVALCLMEGKVKPAEISEATEIDIKRVYKLRQSVLEKFKLVIHQLELN